MSQKKWFWGGSIAGLAAAALVVGQLALPVFAQGPTAKATDAVETPSYVSFITVDQALYDGMKEDDEGAALAGQARITADAAETAALTANPGARVMKVELDNENGALVYSVQLDNGSDVKVDAGNGTVLVTEKADGEDATAKVSTEQEQSGQGADTDNVQDEVQQGPQDQADGAQGASEVGNGGGD